MTNPATIHVKCPTHGILYSFTPSPNAKRLQEELALITKGPECCQTAVMWFAPPEREAPAPAEVPFTSYANPKDVEEALAGVVHRLRKAAGLNPSAGKKNWRHWVQKAHEAVNKLEANAESARARMEQAQASTERRFQDTIRHLEGERDGYAARLYEANRRCMTTKDEEKLTAVYVRLQELATVAVNQHVSPLDAKGQPSLVAGKLLELCQHIQSPQHGMLYASLLELVNAEIKSLGGTGHPASGEGALTAVELVTEVRRLWNALRGYAETRAATERREAENARNQLLKDNTLSHHLREALEKVLPGAGTFLELTQLQMVDLLAERAVHAMEDLKNTPLQVHPDALEVEERKTRRLRAALGSIQLVLGQQAEGLGIESPMGVGRSEEEHIAATVEAVRKVCTLCLIFLERHRNVLAIVSAPV